MKKTALVFCAAALLGISFLRVDASTGPIPLKCDRACLEGILNQYRRVEMIGPSTFFHLKSPWPGGLSGK